MRAARRDASERLGPGSRVARPQSSDNVIALNIKLQIRKKWDRRRCPETRHVSETPAPPFHCAYLFAPFLVFDFSAEFSSARD